MQYSRLLFRRKSFPLLTKVLNSLIRHFPRIRQFTCSTYYVTLFTLCIMKSQETPARYPLWCSARMSIALVGFFGFAIQCAQKTSLSVAIVCMVNNSAVQEWSSMQIKSNGSMVQSKRCPARQENASTVDGEFFWTKPQQGLILGAFFWGYVATQLLGGTLSEKYSGKYVLLTGMTISTIATLLIPIAANCGYIWMIIMRVIVGMGEGVFYPAMHSIWSHWAPHSERTILVGCTYAGAKIGIIISLPVSGAMCAATGWQSVFYLFGGLSGLWCIVWLLFTSDTPGEHRRITEDEKEYIEQSLHEHMSIGTRPKSIPWSSIIKSGPVWAIIIGHFCTNFGAYLVMTEMPTYMNEVLRFNIKSNGLYSSFPYMASFVVANLATIITDFLRHNIMSTRKVRVIMMFIALDGMAAFLIGTGYLRCYQSWLAVLLFTCASGINGFEYGGYLVNHVDIAPRYAGTLMGISNTFATVDGIIVPYIASAITQNIAGALLIFGSFFYAIFSSADVQSWALVPSKSGMFTATYKESEDLENEPLLAD